MYDGQKLLLIVVVFISRLIEFIINKYQTVVDQF